MKMKRKSFLAIAMFSLGVSALAGCGGSSDPTPSPSPTPTPDPWYVISEKAMNSFLNKIQAQGYMMVGGDLTTAVYDQNMVTWFFKEGTPYDDHFCATVNGESYYGFIDYDLESVAALQFVDKKPSTEVFDSSLPTYFLNNAISGGNIWSIFHNNDQEHPMRYRGSQDLSLYQIICRFCNLDEDVIPPTMQDLVLELDAVDVNVATLTFKYNPGGTHDLKDGSVTITFNEEVRRSDYVLAWVNDPNRQYPTPIGEYGKWPNDYIGNIDSIFSIQLGLDGNDPLPYDDFFSYATNYNYETIKYDGFMRIHDFHAGEEELAQYKQTLLDNNYVQRTDVEEIVFRSKTLREREGYKLYSEITLELDDGLVIIGQKYYTSYKYEGRTDINDHLKDASDKYIELPDSENIISWSAEDNTFRAFEDKGCSYDTNLYMHVYLEYSDADAMDSYLDNYFAIYLKDGFVFNEHDGTYSKADLASRTVVKISDNDNDVADILFYNYRRILPSEGYQVMVDAGFPSPDLPDANVESILEQKDYYRLMFGGILEHYYWATFTFESNEDLLSFVDSYVSELLNAGFVKAPEVDFTCRYKNSDESRRIVMDYDDSKGQGISLNAWILIK